MYIRKDCIFCKSNDLSEILTSDIDIPQGLMMIENINKDALWMPYNIQKCNKCNIYQNKYLAELNQIYQNSHISPIGNIRNNMDIKFSKIINENENIKSIVEIGGGKGMLADILLNNNKFQNNYYIVDPVYIGNRDHRIIINNYVEEINLNEYENINTIIMSHVFEHFYEPNNILDKLLNNDNIKYIYMCHPNFDEYVKYPFTYNILHCEHTFYINNDFLINLIEKYGFKLKQNINHDNYCIFLEFEKQNLNNNNIYINNNDTNIVNYLKSINDKVSHLNEIIENIEEPIYMWPCSVHSITLFNSGLNYKRLSGILDNSNDKIGKYMYGNNLKCLSFKKIIDSASRNNKIKIILNGGCYNNDININEYNNVEFIL
jgi:hypothetical protein